MRTGILLVLAALAAGCVTPTESSVANNGLEAPSVDALAEPFILEWKGHVVVGALDVKNHDQPTEQFIFPYQQAGFNIEVPDAPQAIEVRVDWKGEGSFHMHPHWLKGDDATGQTQYYGYFSPEYTTGTGCIRLPEEDMAPGVWPMMIHPGWTNANIDFTITVGLLGTTAKVLPEMHGHRADGNYYIADHEVLECQFLA